MKVKPVEAAERPPLTSEQFAASPEFKRFKSIMRKLLKVPKPELDRRVQVAKETSPRAGNPSAPGRKQAKASDGQIAKS